MTVVILTPLLWLLVPHSRSPLILLVVVYWYFSFYCALFRARRRYSILRLYRRLRRLRRPASFAFRRPFHRCKPAREARFPSEFFLFPVSFEDSIIQPSQSVVLSSVGIPLHKAPASYHQQTSGARQLRRRRQCSFSVATFRLLCGALLFFSAPTTYALPGTKHAVITNASSLNKHHQHNQVASLISRRTAGTSSPSPDFPKDTSPDEGLNDKPFAFIVDTDSRKHCIDTGANRIIVNNISLLKNFQPSSHPGIKGVGGGLVEVGGTGTYTLHLQSDSGHIDSIKFHDAVYVPSSPYNLMPPQLLVKALRANGYDTERATHDDEDYAFNYSKDDKIGKRTTTIRMSSNSLFLFRSAPGFRSFSAVANYIGQSAFFCGFVNGANVVEDSDDEDDSPPTLDQTREAPAPLTSDQTREVPAPPTSDPTREADVSPPTADKTREAAMQPDSVPFTDIDFDPSVPM